MNGFTLNTPHRLFIPESETHRFPLWLKKILSKYFVKKFQSEIFFPNFSVQKFFKKFLSENFCQKKSTQKCIKLISWLRLVCKNSWWDLGVVKCTFACPLEMFVNMCQFTTKIEKPGTSVYCVVITNTQQWSGRLTSTKPRSIFCNYRRLLCAPPWLSQDYEFTHIGLKAIDIFLPVFSQWDSLLIITLEPVVQLILKFESGQTRKVGWLFA